MGWGEGLFTPPPTSSSSGLTRGSMPWSWLRARTVGKKCCSIRHPSALPDDHGMDPRVCAASLRSLLRPRMTKGGSGTPERWESTNLICSPSKDICYPNWTGIAHLRRVSCHP